MSLDLTSALFLAPAPSVHVAGPLGLGRPAVVAEPPEHRRVATELASGLGAEDGVLARSSFHGLLDAIECAATTRCVLLIDEHAYPVARWAAAAASAGGPRPARPLMTYRHLDAADARRLARRARRPAVIITDGICGSCLRAAPVGELSAVARRAGGRLVIDDTLAVGVLGRRAPTSGPLGSGGAGTASWLGVPRADMVVVASLAKGYGVPIALLAGPAEIVARVRREGSAHTHASPPCMAEVKALRALPSPAELACRRRRLGDLIRHTRQAAHRIGLTPAGIPFPVVHLGGVPEPIRLRDTLARHGIHVLVTAGGCTGETALTVCLRADLTRRDVDRLTGTLDIQLHRSAA